MSNHSLVVEPHYGNNVLEELEKLLSPESIFRRDEPLARRTTLRVGGPADVYVEPASETDLASILKYCGAHGVPVLCIGRGSNLLIKDGGVRGVVFSLAHKHFSQIKVVGYRLHCGAGARLKQVASEAKKYSLTGLEFLEGIPGTIGGALRMNAGAMGGWAFDVVESIRFMGTDGLVRERAAVEVEVQYRSCPLLKTNIALGAVLKAHPAGKRIVEERMNEFARKRWTSQPAAPSAGCIFKNPAAIPAGKMIDELGLKGMRVGGAVVSQEHGNFIVTEAGATAQNVLDLIEAVRERVKAERGIDLETEVEIVGE